MKSRIIRRIKNRKGVIIPFNLSGHGRRIYVLPLYNGT